MEPCQDYIEKLMLYAYGELEQRDRVALKEHLKGCEGCRQEQERLVRLLELIKETMPSPELSQVQSRRMTGSVVRELKEKQEKTWWRTWRMTRGYRAVSALAAACLIVFVISWFSIKTLKQSPPSQTMFAQGTEHSLNGEDIEVIENLEFLEQMDVLNKLVERVDESSFL